MADTVKPGDGPAERRRAIKMREVVELVVVELRALGMTEEMIETFLARSRKHWQTTRL
jgi:hypothetical protein